MNKDLKIKVGKLWIGETWENAIIKSLDSVDCGIEEVWEYKNKELLLCDEKVLIGYCMFGWGNRKKYKTRIPKKYNNYVKELLK